MEKKWLLETKVTEKKKFFCQWKQGKSEKSFKNALSIHKREKLQIKQIINYLYFYQSYQHFQKVYSFNRKTIIDSKRILKLISLSWWKTCIFNYTNPKQLFFFYNSKKRFYDFIKCWFFFLVLFQWTEKYNFPIKYQNHLKKLNRFKWLIILWTIIRIMKIDQ